MGHSETSAAHTRNIIRHLSWKVNTDTIWPISWKIFETKYSNIAYEMIHQIWLLCRKKRCSIIFMYEIANKHFRSVNNDTAIRTFKSME